MFRAENDRQKIENLLSKMDRLESSQVNNIRSLLCESVEQLAQLKKIILKQFVGTFLSVALTYFIPITDFFVAALIAGITYLLGSYLYGRIGPLTSANPNHLNLLLNQIESLYRNNASVEVICSRLTKVNSENQKLIDNHSRTNLYTAAGVVSGAVISKWNKLELLGTAATMLFFAHGCNQIGIKHEQRVADAERFAARVTGVAPNT